MELLTDQQRGVCRDYGADCLPPAPGSKVGIALQTLDRLPIHGVRLPPTETTCGWYIHGGEWSDADNFYQPLCVEHLAGYCGFVLPLLALPPGWRFMADAAGFRDVWQTPNQALQPTAGADWFLGLHRFNNPLAAERGRSAAGGFV